jgi:hypothetical protein
MVPSRVVKAAQLAKFYGIRYTSPLAAQLLARLAVNLPCLLRWQCIPLTYDAEPFRIVDFACGDGALLTATYDQLAEEVIRECGKDQLAALHLYLLADGLWGFDIQPEAVRIAASRLKARRPQAAAEPRHLVALALGKVGRQLTLGSLDLLRKRGGSGQSVDGQPAVPLFHLAVMNPPFARSVGGNLLFGDFPAATRKALQSELRRLLRGTQLEGTGQAGLGAAFLGLADRYLAPSGRLAMVLPKALLGGVAWQRIRELLLDAYWIEAIVASFEGPDAWNFSEDTSLSEVLLLARKRQADTTGSASELTTFVNLWRKPATGDEVASLCCQTLDLHRQASQYRIEQPTAAFFKFRHGAEQIGEGYSAQLTTAEFGRYQVFAQADLNRALTLLCGGTLQIPGGQRTKSIPLAPVGQFAESVGPDVRQVHSAFQSRQCRLSEDASSLGKTRYAALWNHDSSQISTMAQSVNATLLPRQLALAKRLWERGSAQLLLAERAWLTTVRVLAVLTPEPVLSNVWWTIRTRPVLLRDGSHLDTTAVAQLLCLWFNSSLGLLLLLSRAETTRGPWVKLKKRPLHRLPVVDLHQLEATAIKSLRDIYGEVRNQQLGALPAEFAKPSVRRRIDGAFDKALRLDTDLTPLYELLAQDPTITCEPLSRFLSEKRASA